MRLISLFGFLLCASTVLAEDKPRNAFDFNFCGGERVYPIVGVNIATACGPRNQIALGRRGKISWYFPAYGSEPERKGSFRLSDEKLDKLTVLAEAVMMSGPGELTGQSVIYKMGINFSARRPSYVYTSYSDEYTPSNKLLQTMRSYIPDAPKLPDCAQALSKFDPTMRMHERLQLIKSVQDKVSGK